jgi:hypothetical protein
MKYSRRVPACDKVSLVTSSMEEAGKKIAGLINRAGEEGEEVCPARERGAGLADPRGVADQAKAGSLKLAIASRSMVTWSLSEWAAAAASSTSAAFCCVT